MYYKAVPTLRYADGREIDTRSESDPYHYGRIVGQPTNQLYYDAALDVSAKHDIPLVKLVECALERSAPDDEDFWCGPMPTPDELDRLDEALGEAQFGRLQEIEVGLREALIERARQETAPGAPSRRESVFVCDTLEDVARYRAKHTSNVPHAHVECVVEALYVVASFRGDMDWLDQIDLNTMSAAEAQEIAEDYWRGASTSEPLYETLLQGRFRFGPPIPRR